MSRESTVNRHATRARRGGAFVAAATLAVAVLIVAPAPAAGQAEIRNAGVPDAIKDSYIVVLKDTATEHVTSTVDRLAAKHETSIRETYRFALSGFTATMSEPQARRLAADPEVAYVEQDRVVTITNQPNPPWGLDRIDQRSLPMDDNYNYDATAQSVHVYVIDTGIRITHHDFGGRASYGWDTVNEDADAGDCHGHGTHVAGIIGGTVHGVAKRVRMVAVKAMNCEGKGTVTNAVQAIDWVTGNARRPAVANLSLGAEGGSSAMDDAIKRSIAAGITYTVAAGNDGDDACDYSPSRVPAAITVGATTIYDRRSSYSNYGSCVDLFAPGTGISSWNTSNTATRSGVGTSVAAPHVAGVVALYLAKDPTALPSRLHNSVVYNATAGVQNRGNGSPDKLLYRVRGPVITALGCTRNGNQYGCELRHSHGVPPISVRWYWNGTYVPTWNDAKSISVACADSSIISLRAVVSDALGGSADQRSHNIFCGLIPG